MLREHLRRLADQHRHIGFDSKRFDDAMALHQTAIVLDLHLDSLLSACLFDFDLREEHSLDWKPKRHVVVDRLGDVIQRGKHRSGYNHSDAPRMVKGGLNGAVFGIHWWPKLLLRLSDPYDGIQARAWGRVPDAQPPDRHRRFGERLEFFAVG